MFSKNNLLDEIQKKGWSRYKLSKESGVAQTTLRDIFGEKQVTPSTKTLDKIALALDVPISAFFDGEREYADIEKVLNKSQFDFNHQIKPEKDIEKMLKETLNLLKHSYDALTFDGEPLDKLSKELLTQCLEHSIKITKRTVKENRIPQNIEWFYIQVIVFLKLRKQYKR